VIDVREAGYLTVRIDVAIPLPVRRTSVLSSQRVVTDDG
jgi:hypothetical protein